MTKIKKTQIPKGPTGQKDANDWALDKPGQLRSAIEEVASQKPTTVLDKFRSLSATCRIEEMEENLGNDAYVIDEMALSGQMTFFYAWPSTGKTLLILWFLINAIKRGDIEGEKVFYINADDNYKGLLTKSKIARKYGFHMISPAEVGMTPKDILDMLQELALTDDASGNIIILDTVKKFADMMVKSSQAGLYEILRQLVAKNATVILLGHANKHLNSEGDLVYEGTGDTKNDVDCMYSMYRMADKHADEMVVEFRNEKDRGDVTKKVSYSYSQPEGMPYYDKLSSIKRLSEAETKTLRQDAEIEKKRKRHESEILFIKSVLSDGPLNQSQIVRAYKEAEGEGLAAELSKRSLLDCLDALTGIEWNMKRSKVDNNAKRFELIDPDQYRATKWGER